MYGKVDGGKDGRKDRCMLGGRWTDGRMKRHMDD